jgi:hypothetical protein
MKRVVTKTIYAMTSESGAPQLLDLLVHTIRFLGLLTRIPTSSSSVSAQPCHRNFLNALD